MLNDSVEMENVIQQALPQEKSKNKKKIKYKNKKIHFGHIGSKGQSLQHMEKGSCLFTEMPRIIAISEHKIKNICASCLQMDSSLAHVTEEENNNILCSKCQKISYCSTKCLNKDIKFHEIECEWLKSCSIIPSAYSRLVGRFIIKYIDLTLNNETLRSQIAQYNLMSFLKTMSTKNSGQDFHDLYEYLPKKLFEERITLIELVANSILKNSHEIYDIYDESMAVGDYRFLGILPHCCSFNADVFIRSGGELIYYAAKDIKKGEQITIPYINLTVPQFNRKKVLQNVFGCRCECPICSQMKKNTSSSGIFNFIYDMVDVRNTLYIKKALYSIFKAIEMTNNSPVQIYYRTCYKYFALVTKADDKNNLSSSLVDLLFKTCFKIRCYKQVLLYYKRHRMIVLRNYGIFSTARYVSLLIA
ncbi:hypothetical protein HZS_1193, partial [Henneguya salminicola]